MTDFARDVELIKKQLADVGFYYQQGDCASYEWGADQGQLLKLGRKLGQLYVPDGMCEENPIITTAPRADATAQQAFDHQDTIGWHNDFSTMVKRPRYSVFSIRRQDPKGSDFGAWGVLPVKTLLLELSKQIDGNALLAELAKPIFPFPINNEQVTFYPILALEQDNRIKQCRFYHYAITQGLARANLAEQQVKQIRHLIDSVEQTACRLAQKRLAITLSLIHI